MDQKEAYERTIRQAPCDVCGHIGCVSVASSAFASAAFAFCRMCVGMGAVPLHVAEYALDGVDEEDTNGKIFTTFKDGKYINYITGDPLEININGKTTFDPVEAWLMLPLDGDK